MSEEKRIIGVVHLPPFNGFITEYVQIKNWLLEQIKIYMEAGICWVMIQDQTPERKASLRTVSQMASLGRTVKENFPDLHLGVMLEANDGEGNLYVAEATGAEFIRIKVFVGAMVKAGGVIQGEAEAISKVRCLLKSPIQIYADIYDRMGVPLKRLPLEVMAKQAVKYGADGIILTGANEEESLNLIREVKKSMPQTLVLAGGGVNKMNVKNFLQTADGVIVSSCLLKEGTTDQWDKRKIHSFLNEAFAL